VATLDPAAGEVKGLESQEQRENARAIIATGIRLKVPERGLIVAIATAMQESTLRNLNYGDRDSVGLFQQRNAWGTREQRTDPEQAAAMFFTGGHAGQPGLLDIKGWQAMPVTAAAQAVQRSAFPTAYARWESLAVQVVSGVSGAAVETCDEPAAAADGAWVLPVSGYTLTSPFGMRYHPIRHVNVLHAGADMAVDDGTAVKAASSGKVTIAGGSDPGGYGLYVEVDHGKTGPSSEDIRTRYGHLSKVGVSVGDTVKAGQQIALSGHSGGATGPHLHFEVRTDGTPIDPIQWIKGKGLKP
jgi:murein DD-endopeptidase MepM/ murein hydrolase activator NlpD